MDVGEKIMHTRIHVYISARKARLTGIDDLKVKDDIALTAKISMQKHLGIDKNQNINRLSSETPVGLT